MLIEVPWIMIQLYIYIYEMGFPGGSAGKEFAFNAGDLGIFHIYEMVEKIK